MQTFLQGDKTNLYVHIPNSNGHKIQKFSSEYVELKSFRMLEPENYETFSYVRLNFVM